MTTLDQIERLALELPEADRAKLASHLLESLPPGLDEEDDGISEAIRRDAELDSDPSRGITLEEFDSQIRQRRAR
jgi:putative addiction module component (TIGR02574 family)